MRFKDVQCVSCKNIFTEEDDVVVCPTCGSPHHRACWLNKGDCENKDLHSEGFVWQFPEELREKPVEPQKEVPDVTETDFQFKNGERAVICPYCSTINYGNDAFCIKCRKPFFEVPPNENYNDFAEQGGVNSEAAFNYYQQFGGLRPDILIDEIPVQEYADYIGEKKSGRYIRKFATMERFNKKISFSACAFLFGPIWYFYRKLFKEGAVYLLIMLLFAGISAWGSLTEPIKLMYEELAGYYPQIISGELTVEEFEAITQELSKKYSAYELSKKDTIKTFAANTSYLLSLGATLAFALAADFLYQRRVKAEILKTRTECYDMFTYRQTLRTKGTPSVAGAVIAGVSSAFIYVLPMIPLYIILYRSIL